MIDESRLYRVVGERLRDLRGKKMTQAELAQLVKLERTSITNIEKGVQKMPLHVLFRICDALSVSIVNVLPAASELMQSFDDLPLEDVSFGGETVKAPTSVIKALDELSLTGH